MRISDVCTRLDDAVAIAALFVCLCRMLYRLRRANQSWRTYPVLLLEENRWRAQRYGVQGTLFDFGKGTLVPFGDLVEELIELVAQDTVELDVREEIRHARDIIAEGTSADRQIAAFEKAIQSGAGEHEALQAVVDELIADTLHGLEI